MLLSWVKIDSFRFELIEKHLTHFNSLNGNFFYVIGSNCFYSFPLLVYYPQSGLRISRSIVKRLLPKSKNVISTIGRNLFLRLSTHETERYLTSVRYDRLFLCLSNSPSTFIPDAMRRFEKNRFTQKSGYYSGLLIIK